MRRIRFAASIVLASFPMASFAQSSSSTEAYTYDELGRLVKVEVTDGDQTGAERSYTYDDASNREQVVSVAAANGGGGLDPLPPECILSPGATQTATDTAGYVWPRVYVASECEVNMEIAFTVTQVSGQGSWVQPERFYQDDPFLNAAAPESDTSKLMYIQPIAGSVPANDQLNLNVEWNVVNYAAAPVNTPVVINPSTAPCILSPADFPTGDGTYAWPRVYAPAGGCGASIELTYTLELVSPATLPANSFTHDFHQGSGALDQSTLTNTATVGPSDTFKMMYINPVSGLATPNNPVIIHVHWSVGANDNAEIAGDGYSVVTFSAP